MISRGVLVFCISALFLSCEKDGNQPIPETLIGEWEFRYSIDSYEAGWGAVNDTTYATELSDKYSIEFDADGHVRFKINDETELEYVGQLTDTREHPSTNISYGISLEPSEGMVVLVFLSTTPLMFRINDRFPLSEEGINGPVHTSIENYFVKK